MKKISAIVLIMITLISMPIYSTEGTPEEEELNPSGWWDALWEGSHLTYDLYARSVLMGDSLNFGGGLSLGVKTNHFRFDGYFQGDYFMSPLGTEGSAAAMEMDFEIGISLYWKMISFWHFDTYIGCDLGYYMQLVQTHYQPNGQTIGFNGIMLRPKLVTELNIGNWYGISVGVFYQFPLFPAYSRYRGVGIMVSIL